MRAAQVPHAARSVVSNTAPYRGGSRNVPDIDPPSSNRQSSRCPEPSWFVSSVGTVDQELPPSLVPAS
jgi:hypothetical protein